MGKPKTYVLNGVRAIVWTNKTAEGKSYYSFNFEKNYKDGNDEWKTSQSFSARDLASLGCMVSFLAEKGIAELKSKTDIGEDR